MASHRKPSHPKDLSYQVGNPPIEAIRKFVRILLALGSYYHIDVRAGCLAARPRASTVAIEMPLLLTLQGYLPTIADLSLKITWPLFSTSASMMMFMSTVLRLVVGERLLYIQLVRDMLHPKILAEVFLPDRSLRWILRYYICVLNFMLATWMATLTPWMWIWHCTMLAVSAHCAACATYALWEIQASIDLRKTEARKAEALPGFEEFLELLREPAPATATAEGERGGCILCWSDHTVPLALPECEHLICRKCLVRLKENTNDHCLCPYCRRPLFSVQARHTGVILEGELIPEIELVWPEMVLEEGLVLEIK